MAHLRSYRFVVEVTFNKSKAPTFPVFQSIRTCTLQFLRRSLVYRSKNPFSSRNNEELRYQYKLVFSAFGLYHAAVADSVYLSGR